ncbi:MAG: magnesium-translocating P-type ATPase [Anaerovoracaceae bacterium]
MKKKNLKNNSIKNTETIMATNSKRLLDASMLDGEKLLSEYNTSWNGYNNNMVDIMREQYGENQITHQKNDSLFKRIICAFVNPFTAVLFVLAIISVITDVVIVAPADRDLTSVIIVMTMVIVSGTLRFVQETRSNKAAEKLSAMVKTTIAVQREPDGKIEIPLKDVVVGDIIHLAAGDMIPADVRILQAKDLFVSQSSLTGESEPLEKFGGECAGNPGSPLGQNNLAFMGSNVISGSAICIVITIGDSTVFGSMAQSITGKKVITSFEKGVNSVSWLLIRFMMCMTPVVLFINGFTKGDWLEAFLFALSVAVGLTPEMLPMIVTTTLAKGAVNMAKKKTVVKNLNSIQNFGAIDVLCTDKTGTLTQDKVVLEYHLDIHGNEDERVLRHGFLNSFHQTGLKNLMDIAILSHMQEKEMLELSKKYHKVDEIPFDFNRRRMSVVVADKDGKTQLITKGAVEEMLSICTYVEYQGKILPLTNDICTEILQTMGKLNADGMRVIAVAQKTNPSTVGVFSVADESEMVLMGYLAFLDPPKETTRSAIKALAQYGVAVKVLTGDNDAVTRCICRQVGMKVDNLLLGDDIEKISDQRLRVVVEETNVFAKLSPQQKTRIVCALRENGHTVGFMGDGINDAAAMKEADVGISVDTAVDVAKESADIILLEKDLMILEQGVIQGRRTFGNTIKYIKMTASSNFGNMFSVVVASAFLPFLPMLPIQILILNLIYDISCISIPWDNMDSEYLKKPRKWDASSIGKFMLWIGPTSSVFDIMTYVIMFFIICPAVCGGNYGAAGVDNVLFMGLFNAGWFVESLWSQTLVIHMIRTPKIPFIQSRASLPVLCITTIAITIGTIIPYTPFGRGLEMFPLPVSYFPWLIGMILCYMALATVMKKVYIKKYGELL